MLIKNNWLYLVVFLITYKVYGKFDYSNQQNWPGKCQNGQLQSPIDIPCKDFILKCPSQIRYTVHWDNPFFQMGNAQQQHFAMLNNSNSKVLFSNRTNDYQYNSKTFVFRSPSEHTINGKRYPLQMQVIYGLNIDSSQKQLLILSIFFEENSSLSYDFADYVENRKNSSRTMFPFPITNKLAFHYKGSMTFSPCIQNVNWIIQKQTIKITTRNLQMLRQLIDNGNTNSRQLQRLNNRNVYLIGDQCMT